MLSLQRGKRAVVSTAPHSRGNAGLSCVAFEFVSFMKLHCKQPRPWLEACSRWQPTVSSSIRATRVYLCMCVTNAACTHTPEAVQVEHVPTMQLLVEPLLRHLLAADDADAVAAGEVLRGRVWEAVHARRHLPAAQRWCSSRHTHTHSAWECE